MYFDKTRKKKQVELVKAIKTRCTFSLSAPERLKNLLAFFKSFQIPAIHDYFFLD